MRPWKEPGNANDVAVSMMYPERSSGKVAGLSHIRLFGCCLVLLFAAGCRAQILATTEPIPSVSPSVDRRLEVFIRSQFSIPPTYDIVLGAKTESDIPDYDNLPVTFIQQGKQTTINLLVSKDGNTLARLQKFDISKNPTLDINVDKRPIRGSAAAKVEIINFDDLECPFCARMNSELSLQTLNHYKGLIKIVYKDYPLQEIHPWAMHAAVDANCLAELSEPAYWAYVDYVHSHGQDISGAHPDPTKSFLSLDNIAGTIATQNKVDGPTLAACLKRQDQSIVNLSLKLGTSLGLEGTPQVFVNGERLPSGARPIEELWPAIDRALKAQGIRPPPATASVSSPAAQPGN